MKRLNILLILILSSFLLPQCTKLDEQLRSELDQTAKKDPALLLTAAYTSMYGPYIQGNRWALQEFSTDAAMAPTRGGDWDDNGTHRAIHLHTWNADNSYMNNTFVGLTTAAYQAAVVLENSPNPQQAAEARFIRALAIFDVIDLWGAFPYRDGEAMHNFKLDPKTLSTQEALDFVAAELTAIIKDLPDVGPKIAATANKNAARFLLMKLYLNKSTFLNRQAPKFDKADMDKVVELGDSITASKLYTVSAPGKYFDNFAPNNNDVSTENIYTLLNDNGVRGGNVANTWAAVMHYNMWPGGNNGWCTLSDYYDKFNASDERRGIYYDYPADTTSNRAKSTYHRQNVGFFAGQQYDWRTNVPLNARNPAGAPLIFTREVTIRTSGATLETAGIRVMKYAYDYKSVGQKNNDWVMFRYADALLMQAEAMLRGGKGSATQALALVNTIRANRGVSLALLPLTLDDILDERARELYWEGWRRQDLIRFGKFLQPWQEKPADPDPKTLLFPFPSQQLAVNPNLKQNPGY
ncbi:RagB/SusD family nutrient uptake outer membrane protein [Niabella sp.]|uniref:RagB/SusD family nutrient uptake outer membrane protein n=1 Tax=Niabella sp. TaxID=1962976 RepID=UPI002608481B|nr:RagB/SusD family nutrient uptake outer membrane protein [Niabella sp.]